MNMDYKTSRIQNLKIALAVVCLLTLLQTSKAQIAAYRFSYTGDWVNNCSGGLQTGSCYLGMAAFDVSFDFEQAGFWPGGTLFVKAASTHGAMPSERFIGDFQTLSNIDAGTHTYFQECWYQHTLGSVTIRLGLQDFNTTFANDAYSSIFLNSSFGVHSTISSNIPAPIFPLTSPGAMLSWNVNDHWTLLSALYDGNPIGFENNPYNLKWHFDANDGIFSVLEVQYHTYIDNRFTGTYKLGTYHHNHLILYNEKTQRWEQQYNNNFGVYGNFDQLLWKHDSHSVAAFVRASVSPRALNDNYTFCGAGFTWNGIFHPSGNDALGIGVVHACLQSSDHETALECTYQFPATNFIMLQPDVQYILHPAGTGTSLPDCIASTLRIGITI